MKRFHQERETKRGKAGKAAAPKANYIGGETAGRERDSCLHCQLRRQGTARTNKGVIFWNDQEISDPPFERNNYNQDEERSCHLRSREGGGGGYCMARRQDGYLCTYVLPGY